MKLFYFFTLIHFIFIINTSAQNIRVYTKTNPENNIIEFYVENKNYCPYRLSIEIRDSVTFISEVSEDAPKFYYIIQAQKKEFFLFSLKPEKGKKNVDYFYKAKMGNPENVNIDENYTYILPYRHKTKHWVIQGYNGRYSHRNQYALDFKMKVGTPICAVRGGIVVRVKSNSKKGGKGSEFSHHANRIVIYHDDGTFAHYLHLKHEGVTVKLGDKVEQGQIIGYSGNTGWSTTPHLHFIVKKPVRMTWDSIPTFFLRKKGKSRKIKSRFLIGYRSFHR